MLISLTRSGGNIAELNPAQWEALRYLSRANRFSRTPAALAGYVGSRGTISQTLIALEQKGLASRQSSRRDGRSVELALTRRGEAVLTGDPLRRLAD
ncbi:MAG: transcriptional regulator, MarR family, partial [Nitrobacter vulgaris]|nr:transcriptional regulator, MarR family [Nitrobacter vulgaris]